MRSVFRARLAAPSPKFWIKLRKRCTAAAGGLTLATAGLAAIPGIPQIIVTTLGYIVAMLSGAAAVSFLAVDDPSELPTHDTTTGTT